MGGWLAKNRPPLTHVFASPLQRAFNSAEAVLAAQKQPSNSTSGDNARAVAIVKVEQLIEQDFGFYEGKPSFARPRNSFGVSRRQAHRDAHINDPGFVDVESKGLLAKRGDEFLITHLLPMLDCDEDATGNVVAVVSHGILLSHLWRRLLLRLPPKSVKLAPETTASKGQVLLEHLGGWSNTGFLELDIRLADTIGPASGTFRGDRRVRMDNQGLVKAAALDTPPPSTPPSPHKKKTSALDFAVDATSGDVTDIRQPDPPPAKSLDGYITTIHIIDGKEHLQGLKRARGGIGRAQYDEKQKTMDSFFKRAKKQ